MADVHDKATRSFNMSKIRGTDTKPELLVRKYLHSAGLRYRLHNNGLPGRPDLTLSKYNTVIFVNGCFWHGHIGCKYFVVPKTRTKWWNEKINGTIERDKRVISELKASGWNTIVIWECSLKNELRDETLVFLLKKITGGKN
jgi:DNA mismatch endonuclease (patch repair protein)